MDTATAVPGNTVGALFPIWPPHYNFLREVTSGATAEPQPATTAQVQHRIAYGPSPTHRLFPRTKYTPEKIWWSVCGP